MASHWSLHAAMSGVKKFTSRKFCLPRVQLFSSTIRLGRSITSPMPHLEQELSR